MRLQTVTHLSVTSRLRLYAHHLGKAVIPLLRGIFLLLCAFTALFIPFQAVGQGQKPASLTGTVQDPQQAVVVGATATLTDGKGVSKTATSDERGEYSFDGLAEGTYTLVVAAAGFQDSKLEGIILSAGQKLRMDVTLEPAKVVTQTTVEGQAGAQVETEQSQIAGNITQKELVKIGLNGRNFTQLIALAPGVSNQTGQDEAKVGVQGSVKYSVNGGRVEYNNFDVDGQDVLNAGVNGSQSTLIVYPSLDALAEVQVLTSNYGAQYGKTASGTILSSVKSGGSEFHGDVYYFNRNEIFNARNFFDQTRRAPLYRKNDVGYTLGGPLYIPGLYPKEKSKTLFFWSEEWRIEEDPTGYTFNKAVPTLAERSGDFRDVCPAISQSNPKPFNRQQFPDCPGTAGTHTLRGILSWVNFPNNQIPISSIGQAILNTNLIPLANAPRGCNAPVYKGTEMAPGDRCFDATISPDTNWREDLFRIDHDFTTNNHLNFRFIHDAWDTTVPLAQWSYLTNSYPTVPNDFNGPGTAAIVRFTQTLSTTLLNQLAFGYTTAHISLSNIPGYGGASSVRTPDFDPMGFFFNNGFGGKIPSIAAAGNNASYGGTGFFVDTSYTPWKFSNPTYTIREDMSKVWGKHTLQFGALFIIAQRNQINPPVGSITGDQQGIVGFSNINNVNGTGNSFADLELGWLRSFTQDSAQAKYYQRYKITEPYLQDDWKITRRLTLNLGLRLSLFGNWNEKYRNIYNWVPSAYDATLAATARVETFHGELIDNATNTIIPINLSDPDPRLVNGLVRCGTHGLPSSCINSHIFNPEPRIGFAWDPFGKGKTSIRGGYGVFFEHGTGQESNTGSLEGSAPVVEGMRQDYPGNYTDIGAPPFLGAVGSTAGAAFPLNVTSIQAKTPFPYVQQWSFGVQQELPGHFISSVSYVGSKGTHLTAELQLNQLHPVPASLNPFLKHQPITADTCLEPLNPADPLSEGFDGRFFHENGVVIGPGDPAYSNLLIACQGSSNLFSFPLSNSLRTFAPTLGDIYSLQNIANSNYHALQTTLRKVQGPLTLSLSYSYSHSIDDSSDRTDATFVNSFDIQANRSDSNFDQRHLIALSYIYQLPLNRWFKSAFQWADDDSTNELTRGSKAAAKPDTTSSNGRHKFLEGWELSGVIVHQSGTPFTIINNASPNGVSTTDNAGVANDIGVGSYVDVIGNPHTNVPKGNIAGTVGPLMGNPSAFAAPRGLTFGDAGRNSFNNPARTNFDTALLKTFRLTESRSLEFRFETFNTFNHTQFRIYNPDRGNVNNTISCYGGPDNAAGFVGAGTNCLAGSSFLHPVDAHRPRTVQLGLKFLF
jgi:hypothetical protein